MRPPNDSLSPEASASPSTHVIRLQPNPRFLSPWAGARLWIAHLRRLLGDARIEAAVEPERALLSLVLRGLSPRLTEAERTRRDLLAAQPFGFMSHSRIAQGPLLEAWTNALVPLVREAGGVVLVPDASNLDGTTLALVRRLHCKLAPGEGPKFLLVRKPDTPAERNAYLLGMHASIPSTSLELLDNDAPLPAPPEGDVPRDPLDDGAEAAAWEALAAAPGAPDDALCKQVLAAMRLSFASFGFVAVASLGRELLARAPTLSREETAEVHTIVALAEYAQKSRSKDRPLPVLLDHHFRAALEAEADPARRSHLFYRLCTNAMRLGRVDDAHAFAKQAVAEARSAGIPEGRAAYLEAWACNGRAYVHARQKELPLAIAEARAALELMDRAVTHAGAPERELTGSLVVLHDNLAELHLLQRDLRDAAVFQQGLEDAERAIPEGMTYGPHRWVKILRAQGKLRQAVARAEEGLALATKNLSAFAADRFAMELAELSYRIGDAARARESYLAALAVRERIGSEIDRLRALLGSALAARRAGMLAEARAAFTRALERPSFARGSPRAEILGALALVAAQDHDEATAELRLAQAREAAESASSPEALVRVARAAGEAFLLLGRPDEAQRSFSRALALVDGSAPELRARTASEIMGALVGLWCTGERDPALVLRALALVPAALADAEATWDLRALLEALADLAQQNLLPEPSSLAGLRAALAAGAERADCEPLAAELHERLARGGLSPA